MKDIVCVLKARLDNLLSSKWTQCRYLAMREGISHRYTGTVDK